MILDLQFAILLVEARTLRRERAGFRILEMETLSKYLAVAAGGALGALARHALNVSFLSRWLSPFPLPTFVINLLGSFIIGFLLTLFTQRFPAAENLRLGLTVGFVGAFTTFSTFEYETLRLIETQRSLLAIGYVALSVALGLVAVWLGSRLAGA